MYNAVFSYNSEYIITRDAALRAKLWHVESGELIKNLTSHGEYTFVANFSPDNKYIVTGGDKNQIIKLWDIRSGALLKYYNSDQHTEQSTIANFSPNSQQIITGSYNHDSTKVLLLDVDSTEVIKSLEYEPQRLINATFSPDGKYIMTNGLTRDLIHKSLIWNAESGEVSSSLSENSSYSENQKPPLSICGFHCEFSPDSKYIVTGAPGNTAKLWALDDIIETPFENKKKDHELYNPQDMQQEEGLQEYGTKDSWDQNKQDNKITLLQKIREEINSIKSLFKHKIEKQVILQEVHFLKEENVEYISEHFNDTISEILGNIDIEYDYT